MKKLSDKILKLILVLVIVFPHVHAEPAVYFYDLPSSHWAYDDIMILANKGIINGYEDGEFRAEANVTVAEMSKIIVLAFNLNSYEQDYYPGARGLNDEKWWLDYADRIRDYYVRQGYDTFFEGEIPAPHFDERPATRSDVTSSLVNAVNPYYQRNYTYMGYRVDYESILENKFYDMNEKLNGYFYEGVPLEHIYIADELGIIEGYPDGSFLPYGYVTRAEFCAMVNRASSIKDNIPTDLLDEPTPSPVNKADYSQILAEIDKLQGQWFYYNAVEAVYFPYNHDCPESDALFNEVKDSAKNKKYYNEYSKIKAEYAIGAGYTTADIVQFELRKREAYDALLEEVYNDIKANIPEDDFEKLKQSELKWIISRDDFIEKHLHNEGSISGVLAGAYIVDARVFRILLLLKYY
ncbi:MAG: S-layer homology domain-containing protein [Clostridiales bacterium]|jgi:hypothetical protein|nr:S-layer homology domain-containing protein [Clostridiales bacterium]